nr:hypothetical protein [Nitrospiraceae bacterium]
MKNLRTLVSGVMIIYSLLSGSMASAASFEASAGSPGYATHGIPTPPFPYNPMAGEGLVAVVSASAHGEFQESSFDGSFSVAAAAYGSDVSYDGIGSPYLLGYAIEPMADAMGSLTCSRPIFDPRCVAGSGATAQVKHRIMLKAVTIPPELLGPLAAVLSVPVRLYYELEASSTKKAGEYTGNAYASFSIAKGTATLFHQSACVEPYFTYYGTWQSPPQDKDCVGESYKSVSGSWKTVLQRSTMDSSVEYTVRTDANVLTYGVNGGTVAGQAVADPFLYIDPDWEYAPYFEVQQESMLYPGQWAEVTRLWHPIPPPVENDWWKITGAMAIPRDRHSATVLPNGKVLIAGGFNGSSYVSSAELYDPSAGTWSTTGSLAAARGVHTATLLPNGKVLVAGGFDGAALSSAELYDPESGIWSSTGSMAHARYRHTATLLQNGKILVAGGYDGSANLHSAEVYDPDAGAWSDTGLMATARQWHTATLLQNGNVLVAGGLAGGVGLFSAELYDPVIATWSTTTPMTAARAYHTATPLSSGKVLIAGGYDGSVYLSSAELFDPSAGTWSSTGSMASPRRWNTATLLQSGDVLVAGGGNDSIWYNSAELYDPVM